MPFFLLFKKNIKLIDAEQIKTLEDLLKKLEEIDKELSNNEHIKKILLTDKDIIENLLKIILNINWMMMIILK